MARRKLGNSVRFEIFHRDGFACQYCGRNPPSAILEIDHIMPVSKGGDDDPLNLITSCFECNRGKRTRDLKKVPEKLHNSISTEKEKLLQVQEYSEFLLQKRQLEQGILDELGRYWFNKVKKEKDEFVFGPGRVPSIKTFLKHLTPIEIMDAMDISFSRILIWDENDYKAWKYFCGVCWKTIKERRGDAE